MSIGDSITNQAEFNNSALSLRINRGWTTWAMALSRYAGYMPAGSNKGVSGENTSLIAGRFTSDLSSFRPGLIFANGGRNNPLASITAEQTVNDFHSMILQAAVMGAKIIILGPLLWAGASGPETTFVQDVIKGLRVICQNHARLVETPLWDPSTMTDDGTHPNSLGAKYIGTCAAPIVNELLGYDDPLPKVIVPGNILPNLFMTGTGGGLTSATGTVADNMEVRANDAGGATVVASKSTNPRGGSWQELLLSGTYSGDGSSVKFINFQTGLSIGAGVNVETITEFEIDAANVNVSQVLCSCIYYDTAFSASIQADDMNVQAVGPTGAGYSGVLRTPPVSLASGIGNIFTQFNVQLVNQGGGSASVSAGVRFGRAHQRLAA